jgi:hypothetical protein
VNKIDFLCVNIYRLRKYLEIRSKRIKGDNNGSLCMDLFHNPFSDRYVRIADLESHMGIQRRREAWETWLACVAADPFHELADELANLAGVSSRSKAG